MTDDITLVLIMDTILWIVAGGVVVWLAQRIVKAVNALEAISQHTLNIRCMMSDEIERERRKV